MVSPNQVFNYIESWNRVSLLCLGTTNYCESILLSNAREKAVQASFGHVTNNSDINGIERLDACCRLLHKCDAQKHVELRESHIEWNVKHCECVHTFRMCLRNLNTAASNGLSFIHSLNATKCYAKDHPIAECVKIETFFEPNGAQFFQIMDSNERKRFFNRWTKCNHKQYNFSIYHLAIVEWRKLPVSNVCTFFFLFLFRYNNIQQIWFIFFLRTV